MLDVVVGDLMLVVVVEWMLGVVVGDGCGERWVLRY